MLLELVELDAFPAQNRGLDPGHEQLRLGRQTSSDRIISPRLAAGQELFNRAFAGIVGRQGQTPVFELSVLVPQVLSGGAGARFRLESLIKGPCPKAVLFGG